MNTKVVFNTTIGRVSVDAKMSLNISEDFLNGDTDDVRGHVKAEFSIWKADASSFYDGHKKYNVDFMLAVAGDIRTLQEQNAEYARKEQDGRHHVDLHTLNVSQISINGEYLRIKWHFDDCYGCGRAFWGNAYPIREDNTYKPNEDFYCSSQVELQVYF